MEGIFLTCIIIGGLPLEYLVLEKISRFDGPRQSSKHTYKEEIFVLGVELTSECLRQYMRSHFYVWPMSDVIHLSDPKKKNHNGMNVTMYMIPFKIATFIIAYTLTLFSLRVPLRPRQEPINHFEM